MQNRNSAFILSQYDMHSRMADSVGAQAGGTCDEEHDKPASTKTSLDRQASIGQPTPKGTSVSAVGITTPPKRWPTVQQALFANMKATYIGSFNVKSKEDSYVSEITAITITSKGQRLMIDCNNRRVKLFSQNMIFVFSVSVPGTPCDITMVNDTEAVVTMDRSLVYLEVTDTKLRIQQIIDLSFDCLGIAYSNDRLFVTDRKTIRALDLEGRELWSAGRTLFDNDLYVCSNNDGRWVAVIDFNKITITVLDANNGALITSRRLEKGGRPGQVSVDKADNIFVCTYINIEVLTEDLQNEHVLYDIKDTYPQAMAYDQNRRQLIFSQGYNNDDVSCIQLSEDDGTDYITRV